MGVSPQHLSAQKTVQLSTGSVSLASLDKNSPWHQGNSEPSFHVRIIGFSTYPNFEERKILTEAGILLHVSLPPNAYLASIPSHLSSPDLWEMGVSFLGQLPPSKKIASELAANIEGTETLELRVQLLPGANSEVVRSHLVGLGGEWVYTEEDLHVGAVLLAREQLGKLAEVDEVLYIEEAPPAPEPDDLRGQSLHRANSLNVGGLNLELDGSGVKVLVRDDGDIGPHIDFFGRLDQQFATPNTANLAGNTQHGDQVAGIMAGAGNLDPTQQGMAPKAEMYVMDYSGGFTDQTLDLHQNEGVNITNSSYSQGCNLGYTTVTQRVDRQMLQNPSLLHVFSGGNSNNNDCGYGAGDQWGNITGGHKQGKLVLTVANVTDDDRLANSSSRGPASDGRLKPDVAAYGNGQVSTFPDNRYRNFGGTSAAAPGVAGVSALLYQAFSIVNPGSTVPAGLVKACLLNSADDLGNMGPDYLFGWGRVNTKRALQPIVEESWQTGTVDQGDTAIFQMVIGPDVRKARFMIYWNDPDVSPLAARALVNDLDITVTGPNGIVHLPWQLDPTPRTNNLSSPAFKGRDTLNNMEQVEITSLIPGPYTIEVRGRSLGQGPQPFYLVPVYYRSAIELTYPSGGEGLVPFENERIRWDAIGNQGTFALEYSDDGGATWNLIQNNIAATRRFYDWNVPSTVSGSVLVAVRRGGDSDTSETFLSIISQTPQIRATRVCQDSLVLQWIPVPGATSYEVYQLGQRFMEIVDTVTTNRIDIRTRFNRENNWFAIKPLGPNGLTGRRSNAIFVQPQLVNCQASAPVSDFNFPDLICLGDTVAFTDVSLGAPETWGWRVSPASSASFILGTGVNDETPILTFSQPGVYRVSLSVVNALGVDTKTQTITVSPTPQAIFQANANGTNVLFQNLSIDGDTYQWKFGDGQQSFDQTPNHTYDSAGLYEVTLIVTNRCGLIDSATQVVEVLATSISEEFMAYKMNWDQNQGILSFTTENPERFTLELWDVQGRVLWKKSQPVSSGEQQVKLNLPQVATGLVLLRVVTEKGQQVFRWVE
ncbi:MAG: S8 family serine peptidase [Bacteroidota bacterium]